MPVYVSDLSIRGVGTHSGPETNLPPARTIWRGRTQSVNKSSNDCVLWCVMRVRFKHFRLQFFPQLTYKVYLKPMLSKAKLCIRLNLGFFLPSFLPSFLLKWPHPCHMEAPGPGIETWATGVSNTRYLTPLCWAGAWTPTSAVAWAVCSQILNLLHHGRYSFCYFFRVNLLV